MWLAIRPHTRSCVYFSAGESPVEVPLRCRLAMVEPITGNGKGKGKVVRCLTTHHVMKTCAEVDV
jgi:hypothetical protein